MKAATNILIFAFCFAATSAVAWGQTTYTWNQTGTSAWTTSTNWTPTRTTPATNDILVFDNGATTTATLVPTETIGALLVSAGTTLTLNTTTAAKTLTISGVSGVDLSVASGCQLNIAITVAATPIVINVATGATGSISGTMDFSSATASTVNQLTAADASGITFNSGSTFTQNTNSTGNVFGSGTSNSVVFTSGSNFVHNAGSNPFQKTQPASVVVFQTGSLFKAQQASGSGLSFSGRTYANFEYNATGTAGATGTAALVMNNLTVTQGTVGFNMTGTPGHAIKGNISVASGTTLTFNPSSAGTINFNGTSAQSISNSGTLTFTANAAIVIGNSSGVTFNQSQTISGSMTVSSGALLATSGTLTLSGTPTISGTFQINQGGFATGGTWTYSSKLIFNNSSGSYGVGNDAYWPSTNGPTDVTVQGAGGITMNVARTVSGTFQTAAGVVNGNNLTLNGTCQINSGGFFTGSPTYGASSTLIYNNSSGSYGSGDEWPSSSPFNVNVQGAGGLTLNASRSVGGTFQTSAGVTNGNNLTINGTCQMNAGGFFTGSPSYAASAPDSPFGTPSTLVYNNGAGGFSTADEWPATNGPPSITIQNATPVTLTASRTISGTLAFTSGTLTLGSNNLTLNGTVSGAAATKCVVTNSTGTVARTIAASGSFQFPIGPSSTTFNPLTIALNAGDPTETFTVRVEGSVNPSAPDNTLCVQKTWNITETTVGGNNATLTFQWTGTSGTGDTGANFSSTIAPGAYRHNGSAYTLGSSMTTPAGGDPYTSSTVSTISTFSPWVVGTAGGLPVQLSSFTGTLIENNRVRLNWTTISEVNNYGFYVQKKRLDESQWSEIANSFIPGHGTTNVPHHYTFTDNSSVTATTQYRLKQVDLDGSVHYTEPIRVDVLTAVKEVAPVEFALKQNYPNPFNPETNIKFSVEQTGRATLEIYNMLGQKVATLFDNIVEAGYYQTIKLNGANLASGLYLYRLQSGQKSDLKKLLLLK